MKKQLKKNHVLFSSSIFCMHVSIISSNNLFLLRAFCISIIDKTVIIKKNNKKKRIFIAKIISESTIGISVFPPKINLLYPGFEIVQIIIVKIIGMNNLKIKSDKLLLFIVLKRAFININLFLL